MEHQIGGSVGDSWPPRLTSVPWGATVTAGLSGLEYSTPVAGDPVWVGRPGHRCLVSTSVGGSFRLGELIFGGGRGVPWQLQVRVGQATQTHGRQAGRAPWGRCLDFLRKGSS